MNRFELFLLIQLANGLIRIAHQLGRRTTKTLDLGGPPIRFSLAP